MNDRVDLFGQPDKCAEPIRQLPLPLGWRTHGGLQKLLIGNANRDAVNAIEAWVTWPQPIAVLYGPRRSGKSSLGRYLRDLCPVATVIDPGPDMAERDLFHVCNRALESRQPLLILCEGQAGSWRPIIADLATRISAAQILCIEEPDATLFAALLTQVLGNASVPIAPDVVSFIAERVERTYDALDTIAIELAGAVHRDGANLGLPTVRRILIEGGHFGGGNLDSAAA